MYRSLCFFVLLLLTGCLDKPDKTTADILPPSIQGTEPSMEYLGVGGWLFRWKGEGVMTSPSYSNPGLLGIRGVPPLLVSANERKVRERMPDITGVTTILVGHAHYDHLLDVPVLLKYMPNVKVYGSETTVNILNYMMGDNPNYQSVLAQIASVPDMHRLGDQGQWIKSPGGHFRMKPLRSMHAGHVGGVNMIPGLYEKPLEHGPHTLWDWRLGTPIAWLIDLLDDKGYPVWRIHYQDSASNPPEGFPPPVNVRGVDKNVDVEILCAGSWDEVHRYPAGIVDYTEPRMVLIGHWENFFASDPGDNREIPFLDLHGMVDIVKRHVGSGVKVYVPDPGVKIAFPEPEKDVTARNTH